MTRRGLLLMRLVLGCAVLVSSAEAGAEETKEVATPEVKAEAKMRFERGVALYAEGEFQLALIEFERVYALVPSYRVLYNIGQVSQQLGRYTNALIALKRYLELGGDEIPADKRRAVEADLAELRMRTASLKVTADRPGVAVLVDGAPIGETPFQSPVLVDAGTHRLSGRLAGHAVEERVFSVAGGDTLTVPLKVTLALAPVAAEPSWHMPLGGWIAWSATAAFGIGATTMGVVAVNKVNELDKLRSQSVSNEEEAARLRTSMEASQRSARQVALTSDILLGVFVASAVIATYITVRSLRTTRTPTALALRPGSGGLQLLW